MSLAGLVRTLQRNRDELREEVETLKERLREAQQDRNTAMDLRRPLIEALREYMRCTDALLAAVPHGLEVNLGVALLWKLAEDKAKALLAKAPE